MKFAFDIDNATVDRTTAEIIIPIDTNPEIDYEWAYEVKDKVKEYKRQYVSLICGYYNKPYFRVDYFQFPYSISLVVPPYCELTEILLASQYQLLLNFTHFSNNSLDARIVQKQKDQELLVQNVKNREAVLLSFKSELNKYEKSKITAPNGELLFFVKKEPL